MLNATPKKAAAIIRKSVSAIFSLHKAKPAKTKPNRYPQQIKP
jgi:hypothetical protein